MSDQDDPRTEPFEPPKPDDGFHQPTAETRRRNLITAAIIMGLVVAWVLLGLRRVLF